MRLVLLCLILLVHSPFVAAKDGFLKPNDVIALVGGEDMVVASELGYLEAFVQATLPQHRLKFRSLAWEGDTVFEQRRDLNYPPLEAQLEKIGATVVIAQFGQVESLGGVAKLPDFAQAYEKLIGRLRGAIGRRVLLIEPGQWWGSALGLPVDERNTMRAAYRDVIEKLANGADIRFSNGNDFLPAWGNPGARDGMHLSVALHRFWATSVANDLLGGNAAPLGEKRNPGMSDGLRKLVIAKNTLWHHYARPQNWAFLAGDRTNQPSSRDHKDLSKRWFPGELEQFVPLIEAKEQEIWKLAAALNP